LKRLPAEVQIIAVGDELLAGRIADTNSAYIGRELARRGFRLSLTTHTGDNARDISRALADADAPLLIVMGGLGPTEDDRTLDAVGSALGCGIRVDRQTLTRVRQAFMRRGIQMPRLAERQARVLTGARLIANPVGMVPGMLLDLGERIVLLVPGVPAEMKVVVPAALDAVAPRFRLERRHSITVRTLGTAEAVVAHSLEPVLRKLPAVAPAYYPSTSGVDVVLTARAARVVRACAAAVARKLGSSVYEVGERPLEAVVGDLLRRLGFTVATAESITGGGLGDRLTDVAGSSDYFLGGVAVYSNGAKTGILSVAADTIKTHGAVSAPTAIEMASGAQQLFGADAAIAVTGIAGPGGATRGKPVGLVFVAAAVGRRVVVERHVFGGPRRAVKERTASAALDLCRRVLEDAQWTS
jgi:nicotinamide-nucleotide amidase